MAAKILVCVSAKNATVALWKRGQLNDIRKFSDDESGWAAFEAYLRRASRSTVSILVDSIDEDYRTETLPRASGSDRQQLVTRKLRQLFRGSPFAAASILERDLGKRHEDNYLLAAVTRPELLAPWLRVVNALRIPINGIYLLPVVTISVASRLELEQSNLLIVSMNEAGLRQTFCKQGHMRVSRLTPSDDTDQHNVTFYSEEINSTRMYLDALSMTHVDDIMTVLILDQDGSLAELPDAVSRERPNLNCVRLGPAELETRLGIQAATMKSAPDTLHLHLLASTNPTMNIAPPTLKTRLQVHQVKKLMYVASAATILFGVTWVLISGVMVIRSKSEADRLVTDAANFQRRYQDVTQRFPESPASPQMLRDSVEAAKRLSTNVSTPRPLLFVLGNALKDTPTVGLKRIEWIHGGPDSLPAASKPLNISAYLVNGRAQFGIVSAEVLAYQGDDRAALDNIRMFTNRIAEDDRVAHVSVLRLPLDLDSTTGLNGSTATQQTRNSAPFQVAVVLRPEPTAQ